MIRKSSVGSQTPVNVEAGMAPTGTEAFGRTSRHDPRVRAHHGQAVQAANRLIASGRWREPPEPGQAPSVASIHPSWGTAL